MGSITTGVGLISGINTAQLIDSLIALESRGKATLQQRVADLQAKRTALLDINARLLNLKNTAHRFRFDKIFQSTLATSSNDDILTATVAKNSQSSAFQFLVKQLVSTSQKLSRGYTDKDTTPLGLSSLSFEFGQGTLAVDKNLSELNGGEGIDRGSIRITDRSGAQATINLSDVASLNEVLNRINTATGVHVQASVDGDHLVITDQSGGAGSLTIANGTGHTTATDLGIATTVAGPTITGTNINSISGATALATLNDGTGVLTQNSVTDLAITARDGTVINVGFGRVNAPISNATLLSDLNNGAGVKIGNDENKDLKIIARDGTSFEINLNGVTTVGGLINRITSETSGHIALSIGSDGKHFTVTDTVGGTQNLRVQGDGVNGTRTARDLGLLNVAGAAANSFEGVSVPNVVTTPKASTINDVITRINSATGNAGKIVASIAPDGNSLLITDTTAGAGNLIIRRTAGNPYAASALGIETAAGGVASSTVDGSRLVASLNSVLVNSLNGGSGLSGNSSLTLTDRSGDTVTINNLNNYDSLSDLITAVNSAASAANVDVTIGYNNVGNGLKVTDSSGGSGNLIIDGTAASALGISGNVASTSIRGNNLQLRYVSESSKLSDLNYGRGVGTGKFRITDALGHSADVDIASDSITLYDVIQEINSRGLAINARVNDNGDGLIIESALDPGETAVANLKVTTITGTTAKDLNIVGTASTIENGKIDGSYERTVTLSATDNLSRVVTKINAAGIPINASIINSGSGSAPFRLNFTSSISGKAGELLVDSGNVDLGITTLTTGRDAKVLFGSGDNDDTFLVTSSSNTIKSVLDGVTITLHQVSDTPVTLTIDRDKDSIVAAVKQLVTTLNDAIGRIDQYDYYNVDTKKKGPLLGNSTTSNVRQALYNVLQGKAVGVDTQYRYLREVGITIGTDGQVQFDADRFNSAYASDPEAVENLFAKFSSTTGQTEEIAPGVTIQHTQETITAQGFGDLFDKLLDKLTNKVNGTVSKADNGFQQQIADTNKRISLFDERLDAKRARLQAQFNAMEETLARLQGQGSALSQLANSVALAQSGGR